MTIKEMIKMKKVIHILSMILITGVATVVFTGCSDDDDEPGTNAQHQLNALNGTWNARLIVDGSTNRLMDDYSGGFSITFNASDKSYATTGGPDLLPLPKSAGFEIGADAEHDLVFDPAGENLPVSYVLSQDGSTLTFALIYSGSGFANGRKQVVEGYWTFEFVKQ
jgi:hypothetical protein